MVKNKYEALKMLENVPGGDIEAEWSACKNAWSTASETVLGRRQRHVKEWITEPTWKLVETRKKVKTLAHSCKNLEHKEALNSQYTELNREVKKSARRDKRSYFNSMAAEAEQAAATNNAKQLYQITRTMCGKNKSVSVPVKDLQGNIISEEGAQSKRWMEYFKEILNRPPPTVKPIIPDPTEILEISTETPSKAEITRAINKLKNNKAAGPDGIPAEVIKATKDLSVNMLHSLFQHIWEQRVLPREWKEGLLVKIPKKGDLGQCQNWRGIMLLSIPSKILSRIILERLRNALDQKLRPEQAGFRQDKSCTDHIATLRIIIEQSNEWQSPLYINFIDFEKAFDSVDRDTIWKLLRFYGIPEIYCDLIQELYKEASCKVIHNGNLSDPFEIHTGVRQGCLLSPTIFLIVIDWIMRETTKSNKMGIQWSLTQFLEDLDYADDLALLSHKHEHMQQKTNAIVIEAEKVGLSVNTKKTQIMKIQKCKPDAIKIKDNCLEEKEQFTYLGSVVTTDGGTDDDVNSRLGKARAAFNILRPVWNSRSISQNTKIRIFNSNVKSVLLYGCETWAVTNKSTNKLQVFTNKCLRYILKAYRENSLSNTDLWRTAKQKPVGEEIAKRKWGWLGHTLRKPTTNITRQALEWNPQGKRRVGRPKKTWRRTIHEEVSQAGFTFAEIKKVAQNRVRWRVVSEALCYTRSNNE